MVRLSVNVNKIALLRNSRGGNLPGVLQAARTCLDAGCHGITVHPRPDARHITYEDVRELDAMLGLIQNDLFDLGADLAVPQREGKAERLRMLGSQVERLERDIDGLNARLAPLTSFVLPGGTPAAAYLHLARTVCRRAERIVVELAAKPDEPVSDAAIHYLNRLSDFLFVASRSANNGGAGDVLWVPGQNR